jgi:hypothetical protein
MQFAILRPPVSFQRGILDEQRLDVVLVEIIPHPSNDPDDARLLVGKSQCNPPNTTGLCGTTGTSIADDCGRFQSPVDDRVIELALFRLERYAEFRKLRPRH